ncbi:MAG: YlmH/Sll1252 family protein [Peptococcaceae bacterium]|nr:YlmH/Sll1252 family protein [Peptococcaceae bacterium]
MLSFEQLLEGQIRRASERWQDVLTDFMPRAEIMAQEERVRFSGVHFLIDGGYDDAERVRLFMTMQDLPISRADMQISVVRFSGQTRFIDYSHRDCLGALMALGFERKCIGDIVVRDGGFDVLTNSEIDDYLLAQTLSIKRVPMHAQRLALDDWTAPVRTLKAQDIIVSQLRLDAIIAKVFNLSRARASEVIRAGLVQVDHRACERVDKICEVGQVIACRGQGKFLIQDIEGKTKKDKIRLSIGKYC